MKIYLIRHARTEDAENELTQRHTTPIVINQEVLDKVEKIKNKIGKVDMVYSSPMSRTMQTAEIIFGKGNFKILDFIYEYGTPKEIVGKPREIAKKYWEVTHKKDKMDINWTPEGGESFNTIAKRVTRLLKLLQGDKRVRIYQKVVIVGHGTFFRHFMLAFRQYSLDKISTVDF